jgi:hypothetical protein
MRRFGQQPILKQLLGKVKRDSKCSSANHGTAAWRAAMEALPSVMAVRAMAMPHLGKPVEHARRWPIIGRGIRVPSPDCYIKRD